MSEMTREEAHKQIDNRYDLMEQEAKRKMATSIYIKQGLYALIGVVIFLALAYLYS